MSFAILCTGCADNEPSKKDAVEKPIAEKPVVNESVTKLEIETAIYTSLLEISKDVKHGNADKWKDKWIIFEGTVKSKDGRLISLLRPVISEACFIANLSNLQFHKYSLGHTYIFSARVIRLSFNSDFVGIFLKFEDKGKLIIPPDYTDIINVDLNILASDCKAGRYEKWIGKRVRVIGQVKYKFEKPNRIVVVPTYDIFGLGFELIISGFDPNSNEIGKYKDYGVYTFTVKIEGLNAFDLTFSRELRLDTLIVEE